MRASRLIVAAVTLVAIFMLVASAPARLLPRFLDGAPVALSGLRGTLWSGMAARARLDTAAGSFHLGGTRWRLEPLSLLSFTPRIALESQWGQQRLAMRVNRTAGGVELRDLTASVDARLVRQLLPVELRGRAEANLERLELRGSIPVHAEGRVVWQDAAWLTLDGPRALGSYVALVDTSAESGISAAVETLAGPLQVEGGFTLLGERYSVHARLGPAQTMDVDLQQALALIAVPEQNGYLLRLDGTLTPVP